MIVLPIRGNLTELFKIRLTAREDASHTHTGQSLPNYAEAKLFLLLIPTLACTHIVLGTFLPEHGYLVIHDVQSFTS